MPVVWDTTLVSQIQPQSPALGYFESAVFGEERVLIPAISVTEVVWGHAQALARQPGSWQLLRWLGRFLARPDVTVIPFTREAGFAAGRMRADCPFPVRARRDRRSKPERRVAWVNDIQLAATAWAFGVPVKNQWRGGSQPSRTDGFQSVPTVLESSTQGPSSGWGNFVCFSLSWMP